MRVLGINFGHSAASALIEDDKIVAAVEEEKLSRIKGHITFPKKSIQYVLKTANVTIDDIDFVAKAIIYDPHILQDIPFKFRSK